jgi:hypothetical protein
MPVPVRTLLPTIGTSVNPGWAMTVRVAMSMIVTLPVGSTAAGPYTRGTDVPMRAP